jgi:hypothetical protein
MNNKVDVHPDKSLLYTKARGRKMHLRGKLLLMMAVILI